MIKNILLILALMAATAVLTGCGSKPPLTPLETFDAYNKAWKDRAFERMWELIGHDYKDEYEQRITRMKETLHGGRKTKFPVPLKAEQIQGMSGKDFYIYMKQLAARTPEETDEYVLTVEDYSGYTHYNDEKIKDEELTNTATLYFKTPEGELVSVTLIREDDNVWRIQKFPE